MVSTKSSPKVEEVVVAFLLQISAQVENENVEEEDEGEDGGVDQQIHDDGQWGAWLMAVARRSKMTSGRLACVFSSVSGDAVWL